MTKEDLIKLGLDDAVAVKVAAASTEELKAFVAKSQYEEAVEAKKTLDAQIKDRDKQLETLKKSTGDAEALKAEIAKLQDANKTAKAEYEEQVRQLKIDNAVESALTAAKAKNLKAVRALLDLGKAELDDTGVKGLQDQIKKLAEAEDTKFLFESSGQVRLAKPQANIFGMKPAAGADKPQGAESLGASFAAQYNSMIMPATTTGGQQ